ncbi:hypothetical protein CMI37_21725 [Candidatus Pacearchaeota archaeon]|nr:hypothetical protein [Candidatus Pacearchaeota archaeon]|tara:strand:+ start:1495 stop:2160 length:666 start_codon:yes stop_codon:yes gene_type:complete
MTNQKPTSTWYQFTSRGPTHAGALRKKFKFNGVARFVVTGSLTTLALIRTDHAGRWLNSVAKDFNSQAVEARAPSETQRAACGQELAMVVSKAKHQAGCKSCRAALGKPPARKHGEAAAEAARQKDTPRPEEPAATRRNGPVVSTFRVDGLREFNLDGLLTVLRRKADEAMAVAGELEQAVSAVESLRTTDAQLTQLVAQRAEQQKAMVHFLEKEKVGHGQ